MVKFGAKNDRRFHQPDSIVPGAGNPQSLNRYSYVSNSPITRIDPSGHSDSDYRDRMNRLRKAYGDKYWLQYRRAYHRGGYLKLPVFGDGSSAAEPVIVFGGSYPGQPYLEGPNAQSQMPIWTTDGNGNELPESHLIQYPGGGNAKFDQSMMAHGLSPDSSVKLICYSSGTESCLMYAKWRTENGQAVDNVVLLGPTFEASNEEGILLHFDGPNGGWASYIDDLLTNGTSILVVDDGLPWNKNEASTYKAPLNATGNFHYLTYYSPHYSNRPNWFPGTNNDESLKGWIYYWMDVQ